jgi:hypothetical protein
MNSAESDDFNNHSSLEMNHLKKKNVGTNSQENAEEVTCFTQITRLDFILGSFVSRV